MIIKHLSHDITLMIKIWASITLQEQDILIMRYANNDPQQIVGKKYNLTKERIRQIENRAINKLKSALNEEGAVL